MTTDEWRFLELKLKTSLKKLARYFGQTPSFRLQDTNRSGYQILISEIEQTAKQYLFGVVYSGMEGYFLKSELAQMTQKLTQIMNNPVTRLELKWVLFEKPDMEQMKKLAMEIRLQVEPVILNYQSHVKGE